MPGYSLTIYNVNSYMVPSILKSVLIFFFIQCIPAFSLLHIARSPQVNINIKTWMFKHNNAEQVLPIPVKTRLLGPLHNCCFQTFRHPGPQKITHTHTHTHTHLDLQYFMRAVCFPNDPQLTECRQHVQYPNRPLEDPSDALHPASLQHLKSANRINIFHSGASGLGAR